MGGVLGLQDEGMDPYSNASVAIWVVVKTMVPFWAP